MAKAPVSPEQMEANSAALRELAEYQRPIGVDGVPIYEAPAAANGPSMIYGALVDILHALAEMGIPKSKSANGGGVNYTFRGIDQVLQTLSVLLAKHRVLIIPRGVSSELHHETDKSGRNTVRSVLAMSYEAISAVDGSHVTLGPFYGEGSDYSDKGTNKAMSNCYKYMAFQTFCIPIAGGMVDVEEDNIESGPAPRTAPRQTQPTQVESNRSDREPPRDEPKTAVKSAHQARKDGDFTWLTTAMNLQRTESELTQWAQSDGFKKHHSALPPHWKTEFKEEYAKQLLALREAVKKRQAEEELDEGYDPKTGELRGRHQQTSQDRRQMDRALNGDDIPFDDPIDFPGDRPHTYAQAKGR